MLCGQSACVGTSIQMHILKHEHMHMNTHQLHGFLKEWSAAEVQTLKVTVHLGSNFSIANPIVKHGVHLLRSTQFVYRNKFLHRKQGPEYPGNSKYDHPTKNSPQSSGDHMNRFNCGPWPFCFSEFWLILSDGCLICPRAVVPMFWVQRFCCNHYYLCCCCYTGTDQKLLCRINRFQIYTYTCIYACLSVLLRSQFRLQRVCCVTLA